MFTALLDGLDLNNMIGLDLGRCATDSDSVNDLPMLVTVDALPQYQDKASVLSAGMSAVNLPPSTVMLGRLADSR